MRDLHEVHAGHQIKCEAGHAYSLWCESPTLKGEELQGEQYKERHTAERRLHQDILAWLPSMLSAPND